MFAKREGTEVSSETIRAWMGDFQHIHPVAKMAARVRGVLFFEREDESDLLAWPIVSPPAPRAKTY